MTRFGWCLDGHHEGCIGKFTSGLADTKKYECDCDCHGGE